jgi:hypothetical protein
MLEDWPDVSDRGSPKEVPPPEYTGPEKIRACPGLLFGLLEHPALVHAVVGDVYCPGAGCVNAIYFELGFFHALLEQRFHGAVVLLVPLRRKALLLSPDNRIHRLVCNFGNQVVQP